MHRAGQPRFEDLHAVVVEEEATGGAPTRLPFELAVVAGGPAGPAGLLALVACQRVALSLPGGQRDRLTWSDPETRLLVGIAAASSASSTSQDSLPTSSPIRIHGCQLGA